MKSLVFLKKEEGDCKNDQNKIRIDASDKN